MAAITNKEAREHLAKMVKSIRESEGLTQTEFGEKIGLSQRAVSKIERAKTDQPRALRKIAEIGGMSVSELLDSSSDKKLTDEEVALLHLYRDLDNNKKRKTFIQHIKKYKDDPPSSATG